MLELVIWYTFKHIYMLLKTSFTSIHLKKIFDNDSTTTASNEPGRIVTSLTPSFNKMTWFEVTEASHHQVSEVLSKEKKRVSVHGWFHSKPVPRPIRSAAEMLPLPIKCLEVEVGVVVRVGNYGCVVNYIYKSFKIYLFLQKCIIFDRFNSMLETLKDRRGW